MSAKAACSTAIAAEVDPDKNAGSKKYGAGSMRSRKGTAFAINEKQG